MVTINIIRKKKGNVNHILWKNERKYVTNVPFLMEEKFPLSENEDFKTEIDLTGKSYRKNMGEYSYTICTI